MTNKNIKDLTNKDAQISVDELSPQELDQISGGVGVEEEEEECGNFACGVYSEKELV